MKTREVRAVLNCSRGTPKAYRALGRRYWGNPPLRPEKVLLGNMRCRRRKSLLGNTLPGKSLLGIAIGDYWGLLGNVRKSVEHRNRYWGILCAADFMWAKVNKNGIYPRRGTFCPDQTRLPGTPLHQSRIMACDSNACRFSWACMHYSIGRI